MTVTLTMWSKMSMEINGLDELMAAFDKLLKLGELSLEIMKDDFLSVAAEEVPRDTDTLANSIQQGVSGGFPEYIVGTDVEYAGYVHDGHMTRPSYVNTPHGKMRYGGGQHMVPGNPFFDRSLDTVEGRIDVYADKAWEELGL